ncbi:MAG: hypothetical protein KBB88_03325 [Candidatus Pacebacteria bacterium]|nr:hypothetical protein [Candidatus Paceibacterota bacterium]
MKKIMVVTTNRELYSAIKVCVESVPDLYTSLFLYNKHSFGKKIYEYVVHRKKVQDMWDIKKTSLIIIDYWFPETATTAFEEIHWLLQLKEEIKGFILPKIILVSTADKETILEGLFYYRKQSWKGNEIGLVDFFKKIIYFENMSIELVDEVLNNRE